jgi:hypothetical protein
MTTSIRLFVSTTRDLDSERAVIARAIAEMPLDLGIEIRRSPSLSPTRHEVLERIAAVDRVYFLLGNDISAPSGLEWQLARENEREILPLRRALKPTPAAQEFARMTPVRWFSYPNSEALVQIISLDLAHLLRSQGNPFGLTTAELARVARFAKRLAKSSPGYAEQMGHEAGGVDQGGVLLERHR